ncbi:hypothetical protein OIU77_010124 [Salix suchowensis]|uniref:SBP-type domain-containing protein n=1 Tax=Salix suchowensis TaxID=1278906 RepID=A0ABQ9A9I0_9ROSI|nr:hypothetical protein OIU77_010124 [Salix suchowensis]
MLEYEWGNSSAIMLSGGDDQQAGSNHEVQDQNRQVNIFDHYTNQSFHDNSLIPLQTSSALMFQNHPTSTNATHHNFNSLFDPRAYAGAGASSFPTTPHPSFLSLDQIPTVTSVATATSYFLIPKSPLDPGSSSNAPRCQAEGCNADLTHAKHYHRRHKVCEFHSKASTVIAAGLTQRFCQQCSRFHLLSEFDNGKRSCRKRLADHNRRRRKSHQINQENQKSHLENATISSSEILTRSPPDSGAHPTSSVTVAMSPPRMSLDCFKQRSYQATASSTSSSSLFFSISASTAFPPFF